MKLTFLGTGTSFGVPQIGCHCATCRSDDPRDRRTRVGAVVEDAGLRLLLDTPPELRLQLIAAGVDRVDAVLFTHEHADHTHGIDDIRAISVRRDGALPMYGPAETLATLAQRFPYIFDAAMKPLPGTSKPEGFAYPLEPGVPTRIGHLEVTPVALPHGRLRVFGYRIGPLAYVTDAKSLPDDALAILRGCEVLVLNALFRTAHPTHLSISEAVDTAARVGAKRVYLTHLTHETTHAALAAALPEGIAPAYDGLTVEIC
ncbi:MAG: MBL fold metallo-hydrolase [Gemmatimonadaceae bacterium]|nr:MBL fold metallo-hydrolase [Gemmatimonadaceae bacterium]